jgi:hypothetical protein
VVILRENRKYGPSIPGPNVLSTALVLETTGSGADTRHKVRLEWDRVGRRQDRPASRNRAEREELVRWVDRNQIRIIERADPAKLDPTSKLAKSRKRAEAEMAAAAASEAKPAEAASAPKATTSSTPPPKTSAARGDAVERKPVSKAEIAKLLVDASRQQSRYQGNKREFLRKNAEALAKAISSFPEPIEQLQDWYAGGGTYGLSIAGSAPSTQQAQANATGSGFASSARSASVTGAQDRYVAQDLSYTFSRILFSASSDC